MSYGNVTTGTSNQTAPPAIDSFQINSKLVWDCLQYLILA